MNQHRRRPPTPPVPPHRRNLPAAVPGAVPATRKRGRREVTAMRNSTHWLDTIAGRLLPYDAMNQLAPDQRARPTILMGLLLMFVLFGIIGLWAAVVPLSAGAIAQGKVMSESNRKEIQHLEGGIVKEILVKDGDVVKSGQVLVKLDSTNAKARSEQVLGQYLAAKATESRLIAERDSKDSITFPAEYIQQEATNAKVKEALETQRNLFATRRSSLEGQISVLNQKAAQSGEEMRQHPNQLTQSGNYHRAGLARHGQCTQAALAEFATPAGGSHGAAWQCTSHGQPRQPSGQRSKNQHHQC